MRVKGVLYGLDQDRSTGGSQRRTPPGYRSTKALYAIEYATPVHPNDDTSQIVASHSLIPDALYHAFAAYGAMMSPTLPLSRRHHEMIAAVVSVTNR